MARRRTGLDIGRILYDEVLCDKDGRRIIARLDVDGMLDIGYDNGQLRRTAFFRNPITGHSWIPSRWVFLNAMRDAIARNEYNLGGNQPCLKQFVEMLLKQR